jgi:hypothetical protein
LSKRERKGIHDDLEQLTEGLAPEPLPFTALAPKPTPLTRVEPEPKAKRAKLEHEQVIETEYTRIVRMQRDRD